MTDTTPAAPAIWIDGDPLMEAVAAAVYEQCETHPEQALTVDDPRNIAAVAATVARQVLGTTTGQPETGCWCGHREERHFTSTVMQLPNGCHDCQGWNGAHAYGQELPWQPEPTPAPATGQPETETPAVDRATVLREAADRYTTLADQNEAYDREHGELDEVARAQHDAVRDVAAGLRRMAAEAQQPTPAPAEETK